MAVSSTPARSEDPTTRPARAPRRPRGEGQWALGHREPLNPNERIKKDDDPLNVRARIETIYAHRGFASIDPQDLRGRFRWWGLYTQRKAGIDGGRTAVLEPHELEDEFFMLRVRVDGGQLSLAQLRVIADISREFARDTADITDRQNIQYHWIRVEDMPEIWRRLESVGLQTTEACGDCPRVVLGSPVAGVARDELLDPTPAVDEIVARYVGDKQFSNLPRKFKTVDLLAGRHPVRVERHRLPRRRPPRARPRLRRLGRRRPLHQPDAGPAARRLGAAGRDPGRLGRRGRDLPRLRLPPAAQPGPAEVPGGRLGCGAVPRGAGEGVPRPHAARRSRPGPAVEADRPRRACTSSATGGTTWAPPRWSGGSPARSSPSWPTWSRRTAATGCGSPRTRSCWCWTCRRSGRSRWSTRCAGSGWRPGRRPGGAARWPAPASSTASWPSSRPRPRGEELVARLEQRLRDFDARHLDPHQRLPERLRPDPGRRHRAQGPAGRRPGRPTGGGLPGPPRRRAGHGPGQTAGFGRKLRGLKTTAEELPGVRRAAGPPLPGRRERGRDVRQLGASRADEEELR